ncbi:hypothetical protein JCM10914A_56270 [Paenibacillus sp. JCM 10914]|uniref:hypothetical protein n=1 Tax=Paenibacillus sp. JCM 10914 TaxID=1236974 RepID=UPI000A9D03B0|nr:hypothetical protein [Paenibacillus sp. JCM 10914]
MSNEDRLKTVGQKLILLSKLRYGIRADPIKKAEFLAGEVGIKTSVAVSAICAALDG